MLSKHFFGKNISVSRENTIPIGSLILVSFFKTQQWKKVAALEVGHMHARSHWRVHGSNDLTGHQISKNVAQLRVSAYTAVQTGLARALNFHACQHECCRCRVK